MASSFRWEPSVRGVAATAALMAAPLPSVGDKVNPRKGVCSNQRTWMLRGSKGGMSRALNAASTFTHRALATLARDSPSLLDCIARAALSANGIASALIARSAQVLHPLFQKSLLIHAKVYEYADKYDITSLKVLAMKKFERWMERLYDHEVLAQASRHVFTSTPD
ncbi:hypothetical protein PSPO01_07225 [Paraphaeosphaeria sporulosa]